MSIYQYNTISKISEGFYSDKGSKFYSYAYPGMSWEEVKIHIENAKKAHPKSRHIPFAYRFGTDNNQFRAFDDGEPSGSAGKPILGQIDSKGLTNVLVFVVRYFGGTKLGIPGLIQAFRTSAVNALNNSVIITNEVKAYFKVTTDYSHLGILMQIINRENLEVVKRYLEMECRLTIAYSLEKHENEFSPFNDVQGLEVEFLYIR